MKRRYLEEKYLYIGQPVLAKVLYLARDSRSAYFVSVRRKSDLGSCPMTDPTCYGSKLQRPNGRVTERFE